MDKTALTVTPSKLSGVQLFDGCLFKPAGKNVQLAMVYRTSTKESQI